MITTCIVFDHRGRTAKGDEGPLEMRLHFGGKTYYINTGIKVVKNDWRGNTIINREDSDELNDRLRIVSAKIEQEINRYIEEGAAIDVAELRRKVYATNDASEKNRTAVVDWIEGQLPKLGHAPGTLKHYVSMVKRLHEFGGITSWQSLTVEVIYEFDYWLHQRTKIGDQKISDAGVYKYHKCFKAVLNRAERMGRIERNPYDMTRGQFKKGEKERIDYLTADEMKAIESLQPLAGSVMAKVRDLFVFQMYTGLAYADSQAFNIQDYQLVGGKWIVINDRIKTGTPYVNQLLPPVVEILERYGWKTPKIDNADYNRNLKGLGMAAGIVKPLHSHMARHTFATWALSNGVSIEIVSKMLGHTNITQTQRYAKVLPTSVKSEFDRLEEIIKNE